MTQRTMFCFLVICLLYLDSNAQNDMKEITIAGVTAHIIGVAERDSMLAEVGQSSSQVNERGRKIIQLNDHRVIYNMSGDDRFYLFEDITDYEQFNKTGNELSKKYNESLEIADSNFIAKVDFYVKFFCEAFDLNSTLTDKNELMLISAKIEALENSELKKYRLSIIAIIGESVRINCGSCDWRIMNIGSRRVPVVIGNGKFLPPASIYVDRLANVDRLERRFSLYDIIKSHCPKSKLFIERP